LNLETPQRIKKRRKSTRTSLARWLFNNIDDDQGHVVLPGREPMLQIRRASDRIKASGSAPTLLR
jgi:hypothetical protein